MAGMTARLRGAIQVRIPLGYEDETGFHFGVPGEPKCWRTNTKTQRLNHNNEFDPGGGSLPTTLPYG
jgi:hypothetical protein